MIRPAQREDLVHIRGSYDSLVDHTIFATPNAKTLVVDGKVVCCGGVVPLWNGVGEAWIELAPGFEENKFSLIKAIKSFFSDVSKDFHRVQCIVVKDNKKALRFAEFIGFKNEGLSKKYTVDKEDVFRLAIVG